MNRNHKRLVCLLLILTTVFSFLPPTAQAAASRDDIETYQTYVTTPQGQKLVTVHSEQLPIQFNPLYQGIVDEDHLLAQAQQVAQPDADVQSETEYVDEAAAAALFRQAMVNREESVVINLATTKTDFSSVVSALFRAATAHTGNPEEGDYLLWQYASWHPSTSYYTVGTTQYHTLTVTFTYYTTAEQESKVTEAVDALLNSLSLDDATDYRKIKGIYDYICANVTYDYENLEDDSYSLKHSAYAALIDGTSVCQGYALLLYRLALELGVDCRVVAGLGGGGAHGWNIVKLGDLYYNADSTWDAGRNTYSYFLVSEDHFPNHTRMDYSGYNAPDYTSEEFYAAHPMSDTDFSPNDTVCTESGHSWTDATCTVPRTCSICGETEGEALGHSWTDATCTEPRTCSICGETEGEALGHSWTDATCTVPKTCSVCGETEGEALGHDYVKGVCSHCGEDDPEHVALEGVSRIYGDNRVYTAFEIADQLKITLGVEKFDTIIVAYGLAFPDALTGSYLAAVKDAPILLTYGLYHTEVIDYIRKNLSANGLVYILGGTGAVDASFEEYLAEYGIACKRLGGADRRETNLLILEEAGVGEDQEILVCTGLGFADSLSASSAGLPILLVYGTLTDAQKEFLATTSGKFTVIGGTGAVSEELANELNAYGSYTRLGGSTRYDTSVLVAQRFVPNPDAVVVAYGMNYPDGLCGGPLAVALNASLILAADNGYTVADAYVAGMDEGIVVGGTGLISDETAREIFDLAADAVIAAK